MESAAVFLVGIAVIMLVFWIVQNDGASSIRDQRGLFRMRPPAEQPPPPEAENAKPAAPGPDRPGFPRQEIVKGWTFTLDTRLEQYSNRMRVTAAQQLPAAPWSAAAGVRRRGGPNVQ